jgi:hypothetical protein
MRDVQDPGSVRSHARFETQLNARTFVRTLILNVERDTPVCWSFMMNFEKYEALGKERSKRLKF